MRVLGTIFLIVIEFSCLAGTLFGSFFLLVPRGFSLLTMMVTFVAVYALIHVTLIRFLKKRIPHYEVGGSSDFDGGAVAE